MVAFEIRVLLLSYITIHNSFSNLQMIFIKNVPINVSSGIQES